MATTAVAAIGVVPEEEPAPTHAPALSPPTSTEFAVLSQQIAAVDKKIDHRLEHYAPVLWVDELAKTLQESQGQMQSCVNEIKESQRVQAGAQRVYAEAQQQQTRDIARLADTVTSVVEKDEKRNQELSDLKMQAEQEKRQHENERHTKELEAERLAKEAAQQALEEQKWPKRLQRAGAVAVPTTACLLLVLLVAKILFTIVPHLHQLLEALTHVPK